MFSKHLIKSYFKGLEIATKHIINKHINNYITHKGNDRHQEHLLLHSSLLHIALGSWNVSPLIHQHLL